MTDVDEIKETRVSIGTVLIVPFGQVDRVKREIKAIEGVRMVYLTVNIGRLKIVPDVVVTEGI